MSDQIVFFGSSPFSAPVLQKLVDAKVDVKAVVTQPDKPVGRHLRLTPNPVKVLAQKNNIPAFDSPTASIHHLESNIIGLVAAYGQIIPQTVLDAFGGHIYNIHPSLLPKYRGPSPLQQQILDDVKETGVTIIQLDAQMDHGPIIATARDTIRLDDTTISLGNRLFALGTDLILNSQFSIFNQIPIPQNHKQATYTKLLTRKDGFLPWEKFQQLIDSTRYHYDPHSSLACLFRAYYPWPGVWTLTPQGQRVKLVSVNPPEAIFA